MGRKVRLCKVEVDGHRKASQVRVRHVSLDQSFSN